MALYAFDGTWNNEHNAGEYGKNTNVVRFHRRSIIFTLFGIISH